MSSSGAIAAAMCSDSVSQPTLAARRQGEPQPSGAVSSPMPSSTDMGHEDKSGSYLRAGLLSVCLCAVLICAGSICAPRAGSDELVERGISMPPASELAPFSGESSSACRNDQSLCKVEACKDGACEPDEEEEEDYYSFNNFFRDMRGLFSFGLGMLACTKFSTAPRPSSSVSSPEVLERRRQRQAARQANGEEDSDSSDSDSSDSDEPASGSDVRKRFYLYIHLL